MTGSLAEDTSPDPEPHRDNVTHSTHPGQLGSLPGTPSVVARTPARHCARCLGRGEAQRWLRGALPRQPRQGPQRGQPLRLQEPSACRAQAQTPCGIRTTPSPPGQLRAAPAGGDSESGGLPQNASARGTRPGSVGLNTPRPSPSLRPWPLPSGPDVGVDPAADLGPPRKVSSWEQVRRA